MTARVTTLAATAIPAPVPSARITALTGSGAALVETSGSVSARVTALAGAGTPSVSRPGARITSLTGSGTTQSTVASLPDLLLEPTTPYAVTARLTDGSTPDEWMWRRVSGDLPFVQNGASITGIAPAPTADSVTFTVAVSARKGTTTTAETMFNVKVPAHTLFMFTPAGLTPVTINAL